MKLEAVMAVMCPQTKKNKEALQKAPVARERLA